MPDQLQLRGGTTTEHNSFTGVAREVTVDTTKKTLVVHDGSQAGGTPLMKEAGANNAASVILGSGGVNAFTIDSNQDITLTGASANVVWDKSDNALEFADNAKAFFGASNDLQIFHDGNFSRIKDVGTGDLVIHSNTIAFRDAGDTENIARFNENGAVELYHDNSKKLETEANGIKAFGNFTLEGTYPNLSIIDSNHDSDYRITNNDGTLIIFDVTNARHIIDFQADGDIKLPVDNKKLIFGASNDLQIYHDGTYNRIAANAQIFLQNKAANETYIAAYENGAVELYFDGSKKFETNSTGVSVIGNLAVSNTSVFSSGVTFTGANYNIAWVRSGNMLKFNDEAKLVLGTHEDIIVKHDSTNNINFWTNRAGKTFKMLHDTENQIVANHNGSIELYHDGSKKAETYSNGLLAHHHLKVMGAQDQNAVIQMFADEGDNTDDQFLMASDASVNRWVLQGQYVNGWHRYIQVLPQAGVQLYYDVLDTASPVANIETVSGGGQITGLTKHRSADQNVTQTIQPIYLSIPTNTTKTITLTLLLGTATFTAGGYANAGQGAIALRLFFGGAMFGTQHYNVDVNQNSAMQNTSITLTKNGTDYQIAIANNSSTYSLNLSMLLESTGRAMGYAVA